MTELEDLEPELTPERLRRRRPEDWFTEKQEDYVERLDQCKDFREILQIVK